MIDLSEFIILGVLVKVIILLAASLLISLQAHAKSETIVYFYFYALSIDGNVELPTDSLERIKGDQIYFNPAFSVPNYSQKIEMNSPQVSEFTTPVALEMNEMGNEQKLSMIFSYAENEENVCITSKFKMDATELEQTNVRFKCFGKELLDGRHLNQNIISSEFVVGPRTFQGRLIINAIQYNRH